MRIKCLTLYLEHKVQNMLVFIIITCANESSFID